MVSPPQQHVTVLNGSPQQHVTVQTATMPVQRDAQAMVQRRAPSKG